MRTKRGTATIHDVAKYAQVSIKTVSRVVNNQPNVRKSTHERVMAAVSALDYAPHPAARGLAGHRTFSLGLLYENPHEFSYIQKLLEGAYAACGAYQHALLLRPCNENISPADVKSFVRQTRVDGLLLTAPIADRDDVTELLTENDIAFALISPRESNSNRVSVNPDDVEASRLLTHHVVSMGHRRIGFIKGDARHGASAKRLHGHLASLRDHGIATDEELVVDGEFDFDSGKRGFRSLWALTERPSAVIACNDDSAAGVVVAAHEHGVKVPQQLSVAGFDDSPTATHTWPALTTVRQPIAEIAYHATEFLIEVLAGGPARQEVLPCELVPRASMAVPNQ